MYPRHISFLWEILLVAFKALKTFGLIPGAFGALWVRRLYQKRRQRKAMEGWPFTEARIQSGRVHKEGWRNILVDITYTYFVEEYRSGTYIHRFRRAEDAEEFIRNIKDKRVMVHYDRVNPDRSVILDRDLELIVLLVPQLR